jgi:hypothetical protein
MGQHLPPATAAKRFTGTGGRLPRCAGGFYHDGRFATLRDVIERYNAHLKLGPSGEEIGDLAKYLMSL